MNCIIRAVFAIAFAGPAVSCSQAPAPAISGPPILYFDRPETDLGVIDLTEEPRDVAFHFENRGLSPLQIERTVSSCGCTGVFVEHTPLQPASIGVLTARIFPRQSEERSATITVYSNDPKQPIVPLRLSWKAVAQIDFIPTSLDLGVVTPGSRATGAIILRRSALPSKCDISRLECFPDRDLSADMSAWTEAETKTRSRQLYVVLNVGTERGQRSGRVVLHLDGCWKPDITLPVHWRVQELIEARPARVFFGAVEPGTVAERHFEVVATDGTVVVSSVEVVDADSGVQCEIADDNDVPTVRVRWRLPTKRGLHSTTIRVRCTEPQPCEFEVPLSVFVRQDS